MPPLNRRFKSSCDQGVPASGRFARVTVLSCDHVGVHPYSTDFSHSLYREVVLMTSLHSNRPFLSNTLMEHHRGGALGNGLWPFGLWLFGSFVVSGHRIISAWYQQNLRPKT